MKVISDLVICEDRNHSVTQIPNAKLRIVHLDAFGTTIELIEYLNPIGKAFDLRTCDVGSGHIAFAVGDLDRVYERLKSKGITFKSPPIDTSADGGEIKKSVYFLDPDGITLEFVEVE